MATRKYILLFIIVCFVFIAIVTVIFIITTQNNTKQQSLITTEQGVTVPDAAPKDTQALTTEQATSLIAQAMPSLVKDGQPRFGVNRIDSPEDGWYIATCTTDDGQDGGIRFVFTQTNNTNDPYTLVYNELQNPPSARKSLPASVQSALGGDV